MRSSLIVLGSIEPNEKTQSQKNLQSKQKKKTVRKKSKIERLTIYGEE